MFVQYWVPIMHAFGLYWENISQFLLLTALNLTPLFLILIATYFR